MTLPRRRHSHRSANRSSYSSHLLLSGRQQLRRRNAKNNGTCCCGVAGCSPAVLDVLLQTGVLCLLSAVAIAIVLVVGKSLSLLQSYLHPQVPPQFDAVAVPSRPLFANSWLLRGGGVNFYYSAFMEKSEPSPVWGMNLEVEAVPTNHDGFRRRIDPSDDATYERERAMLLRRQDEATADMTEDEVERYAPNDQLDQPRKCQRTAWQSRFYPVCNLFHELTMDRDNKDRFYDAVLQHAQVFQRPAHSDRWEWSLSPQFAGMRSAVPPMTLSQPSLREIDENDPREYRRRQVQAIVSERFTSSPRVVTSFGYCGLDLLLEQQQQQTTTMAMATTGRSGVNLSERSRPYSGQEALDLAISIAEAIADLHGFAGGVIVHGQLDLSLFRFAKDTSLDEHRPDVQLTDASTAEFLDWDPDQQAYCSAVAASNSVETDPALEADFLEVPALNEQTDTHSLADMIYSLLTGRDTSRSMMAVPNIDARIRGRGVLEERLSEIMVKTWTDEIPTIFDVLKELREIKRTHAGTDHVLQQG